MTLPHSSKIDLEDYFAPDGSDKTARYEYLDGQLRKRTGENTYHSAIVANLIGALACWLENSPCWIYNSEILLQLSPTRYVYPDITVSCDQRDQEPWDIIHYPCIVVEVLSAITAAFDTGEKLACYQECPTLQDCMLVDSQRICIEMYHREEDGWKLHTYGPGSMVKVESLGIEFPIETVYRGMCPPHS